MKRVLVERDKCIGCMFCLYACSLRRGGNAFNPSKAAISLSFPPNGNSFKGFFLVNVCRQCSKAPCLASCPTGAISRSDKTGAIKIDAEQCIGCAECIEACPFGIPTLDPDTGIAIICDLCDGDPQCVRYCPYEALSYSDTGETALRRRKTAKA